MAVKRWLGNDVGNEGNWGTAANWDPAGVPAAADHALLVSGSQSVILGLDQSAITLGSLIVGPLYTGDIGTAAAWFQINATTLRYDGRGSFAKINGTFTEVFMMGSGAGRLYLKGTPATVWHLGGKATWDTAAVTTLWLDFAASEASLLDILAGSSLVTARVLNGELTSAVAITTIYQYGGSVLVTVGNITTVEQTAGVFRYHTDTGVLTNGNFRGGTADLSADAHPKTLTNVLLGAGAELNIANGAGNIVVTNPIDYQGGILRADPGRTLAVA